MTLFFFVRATLVPIRMEVFVFVLVRLGLCQCLTRDSLQLEVLGDLLFESGVGTEDDAVALDHRCGRELLVGEGLCGVALALERHLESAEVLEHHHLTFGERLDDVVLHALEHRVAVRLGDGGAVVDASGELLHGEFTGLDGLGVIVVGALGTLGVLGFLYCVGNHVNKFEIFEF